MEVVLNTLRDNDRSKDNAVVLETVSPEGQHDSPVEENVYVRMMRRTGKRAMTMASYAEVEPSLMSMLMMAVEENMASPVLVQIIDEVKQFFIEKNKPQTGVVNNYYMIDNSKAIQGNNVEGSYVDCHDNNDVGNEIKN